MNTNTLTFLNCTLQCNLEFTRAIFRGSLRDRGRGFLWILFLSISREWRWKAETPNKRDERRYIVCVYCSITRNTDFVFRLVSQCHFGTKITEVNRPFYQTQSNLVVSVSLYMLFSSMPNRPITSNWRVFNL